MTDARRSSRVVRLFKQRREELGEASCDVCGWTPPLELVQVTGRSGAAALHAHHVIPLACGGHDIRENLVLLCPNHHAVAHLLASIGRGVGRRWTGPTTPERLVNEVLTLEQRPELWSLRARRAMRVVDGVTAEPLRVRRGGVA